MRPVSVAAYTGGERVPSARFRVRQYLPLLLSLGVEVTEYVPRLGTYPPRARWVRPAWAAASLAERALQVAASYRHRVTLLQREMLSTYLTLEPFTKGARVLDVDDAIWLYRDGRCARGLAEICDEVVCGNTFLAEHFSRWNRNVTVLPTAVDTARFCPAQRAPKGRPVIGWSGTSGGYRFFDELEGPLARVLAEHPDAVLRIVSDAPPRFRAIAPERVEFLPWSPENEVRSLQEMTVGLMPVDDSVWSRGKCSYKMLLYMACGVPVVVSPVGMNAELLAQREVGLGPATPGGWQEALHALLSDEGLARRLGQNGRALAVERFDLALVGAGLAAVLTRCS